MNLQVLQEKLSESLSIASRFANPRAQLPVLGNVLLSAKKNRLLINATNLELAVSMSIGAKVKKNGEITLPAKILSDLVGNLAKGQVTLSSEKEQLKIESQNFSSVVSGMNASDFPSIPSEVGKEFVSSSNEDFLKAIACVLFAASIDETRPILTGALMIFDKNKLTLVATDGFRLSKKQISIKSTNSSMNNQTLIVPKNALAELLRLSKDEENFKLALKKGESQILFGISDTVLSSRILEGEFPDFEKIIPKESNCKIRIDREEVLRAVKLASVFARDSANVIKFSLTKESVEIFAESSQSGSQKTKVDAKVEGDYKLKIAFNFRFLEDLLNIIEGDEVVIELGDSNSPGLFTNPKDPNFLHLIMPVKIQD